MRAVDGVAGAASRADCCATACDYLPERVRVLMSVIRQLRAAGEDPAEAASTVFGSRDGMSRGQFGRGSAATRLATVVVDVERAMRELGPMASVEAIALRLCPWSGDAEEKPPDVQ